MPNFVVPYLGWLTDDLSAFPGEVIWGRLGRCWFCSWEGIGGELCSSEVCDEKS